MIYKGKTVIQQSEEHTWVHSIKYTGYRTENSWF